MANRTLLIMAASLELLTGFALIASPSFVARLLLGTDVPGTGLFLGRLCGVALLSFGFACWPATIDAAMGAHVRSLQGMLTCNSLAAAYLAYLRIARGFSGVFLWPAVILHGVLATLFAHVAWKVRSISW